jgi:DnaJ-class molecular chaperone
MMATPFLVVSHQRQHININTYQTMTIHWHRLIRLVALLLACTSFCTASNNGFNPYSTLGVPKDATQDDIKQKYRKLCLQYHPDKNVQKSLKEQQKCEDIFKKVQKANGLIGEQDARRQYDMQAAYSSSPFGAARSGQFGGAASEHRPGGSFERDMYQSLYRQYYQQQRSSQTAFSFQGVDISNLFGSGGKPTFWMPRSAALKSKYVQRVKVPLEHLHSGKPGVDLVLKDNIWKRYNAAFRGGVGTTLLYEALVISMSMIRMVRFPWSFVFGAIVVHMGLPKPERLEYLVDLQAGWKTGTKLTFSDVEPGFEVVFIIEEGKHPHYHRVGSDLYTSITITEKQRRSGGKVKLEPFDDEIPVFVELEPDQIKTTGDTTTLIGKGWPGRKGKGRGDLIISVIVIPNKRARKKEKRHK